MKNFNYKNVLTIAKKELLTYVNSPSYYIVLIMFSLLWFFFFFKNAFLVGDASLRALFDLLPWFSLILAPALTMGLISKEKDDGTLEFLLTHPLRDIELILGKYLGVCLYILPVILFSFIPAFSFSLFSVFDWGAFLVQVIGACLFMFALAALGLFVSGLFSNQIASLLVTAAISFVFVLMGSDFLTNSIPLSAVKYVGNLSLNQHLTSVSRGVLESRDLLYFISFIVAFLGMSYLSLSLRKSAKRLFPKISNGILFVIVIALFVGANMFGDLLPGRLDLTANKEYTLSTSTKEVLGQLENDLTINFYVSKELPVQYSPLSKEISDILRDYQFYSKGRVKVNIKDPSNNAEIAAEAQNDGVREVQFNVVGQEEFQVKKGYLGLVFAYGDKKDAIPAVTNTGDLEYQLTSTILKLSLKELKDVVFLSGHEEKAPFNEYGVFVQELSKTNAVDTVASDEKKKSLTIPEGTDLLVVAGPKKALADYEVKAINEYASKGGALMFLIDSFTVDTQLGVSQENTNSQRDFVEKFGVSVNKDALYDVQFNETIRFGNNGVNYLLPYPFWARVGVTDDAIKLGFGKINFITLPWTASLSLNQETLKTVGYSSKTLLVSSNTSGVKEGTFSISPEKSNFSSDGLGAKELAYILEPTNMSNASGDTAQKGKIVVVGDSDFLSDEFTTNNGGNLAFGLGLVSNLTNTKSLSDIKSKAAGDSKLQFTAQAQPDMIRFSNLVAFTVIPIGVGLIFYFRRKVLAGRTY